MSDSRGNRRFFPIEIRLSERIVATFTPLGLRDVEAYRIFAAALIRSGAAELDPFFNDPDGRISTPRGIRKGIANNQNRFGKNLSLSCLGWHRRRIIAHVACGFQLTDTTRFAQIGYSVHPDYRGKNLAVRVQMKLMEIAKQLGIEVFWAHVHPANAPSIHILENKLGFILAAELPAELRGRDDAEVPDGHLIYLLEAARLQP